MTAAANEISPHKHFSGVPYLADVLTSGIGLILLSILNGHVFRVLYDDETTTLMLIEKFRTLELFEALYGFDVHPPLAYAYYSFLRDLGTSIEGMRSSACSWRRCPAQPGTTCSCETKPRSASPSAFSPFSCSQPYRWSSTLAIRCGGTHHSYSCSRWRR